MSTHEDGATAVEFALVVPVLLALILGIIAFGHAYFVQSVLSNAARDAVRVVALQDDSGGQTAADKAKQTAVDSAAPSLTLSLEQVDVTPTTDCSATDPAGNTTATVVITYPMQLLGGIGDITLTGRGTMRCNG